MIGPGAEVRHHDEPLHAGLAGRIDHPDRGVAVDGVGAGRVSATGSCGEHHRVVAGEQIGQRGGVQVLDIGDQWVGAGGADVVGVVGIADD